MKPDKHFAAAAGILIAAACLIMLTWLETNQSVDAQRVDNARRVTGTLSNEALILTEQVNRQILGIDQTLRFFAAAWEANPVGFDLEAYRRRAVVLNGLTRDMVLTDENGIIRQSSVVEAVNQNASGMDYFRALADPAQADDGLFIGPAAIDGIMRQWHMNVARALHHPDGSFAGVIDTDYRIAAVADVFSQLELGPGAFTTLAGLDDGKLRGLVSASSVDPGASVSDTPMFAAIKDRNDGIWTGPSANDAVRRIHAFRHVPDRRLAVIVAMNEEEATRPAQVWRQQAYVFAGCITALLVGVALLLMNGLRLARRREALMREHRAVLAASNAQLEVARVEAIAKAEQLEAMLARMTDGVSLIDGHMCLVEWNARFPEIAGVPAEMLRIGLPMEEILRAQIMTGQFGIIQDAEAEIDRRMARLRAAPFGVSQRQRPDGRTVELRRNRLSDGGFVTLYSDVTERTLTENALRKAQGSAEAAILEKSRFVALVSEELRAPLNTLLIGVQQLQESGLAPAQQTLAAQAVQSGETLLRRLGDISDRSQIEAGTLAIQPNLFEVRALLDRCAGMMAGSAAGSGQPIAAGYRQSIAAGYRPSIYVNVAPGTPSMLFADQDRLRQVTVALLENAIARPEVGEISLMAEPGRDEHEAVRLIVRDNGPVLPADTAARLFRSFPGVDHPAGTDPGAVVEHPNGGFGSIGLSICQKLMALMGGQVGWQPWQPQADTEPTGGRQGNAFWLTLPIAALPYRTGGFQLAVEPAPTEEHAPAAPLAALPGRTSPRTRILLAEDSAADQHITASLLRREGHHVDTVATGLAAAAVMQATPYDLVFVDLAEPGRAEDEVRQIVRNLPEPGRSTPMVALTDIGSDEDEAMLKAAGLDGWLAKPVSAEEMLDELHARVWVRVSAQKPAVGRVQNVTKAGQAMLAPAGSDPGDFMVPPVLSAERIDELRSILPPATFANLVQECLIDLDNRLPALRRALTAGAPAAVAAHAHAMVGMAASYGMAALEKRLRLVMDTARDGDLASLGPTVVADVQTEVERASNVLRELLRTEVV